MILTTFVFSAPHADAQNNSSPASASKLVLLLDTSLASNLENYLRINRKSQGSEENFWAEARLMIARKQFKQADNHARAAISSHPELAAPYIILGKLAEMHMEDEEALKNYRKAFQVNPRVPVAAKYLARILRQSGDFKGSMAVVQKAQQELESSKDMSGDANEARYFFYQTMALDLIESGKYAECIPVYKKTLLYHPDDTRNIYNLIKAHVKTSQFKEALDLCDKRLSKYPSKLDIHWLRAQALVGLGRKKEAIDTLTAIVSSPDSKVINAKSIARKARELRVKLYRETGQRALADKESAYLKQEVVDAYNDTAFRSKDE